MLVLLLLTLCFADINKLVQESLDRNHNGQARNLFESSDFKWRPIRLKFEFLDSYEPKIQAHVNSVLNVASTFLGRHIMVRQFGKLISYGSSSGDCVGVTIPEVLASRKYNYDAVFFTRIENNTDNFLAYAGPCFISTYDQRPIFGLINWNSRYINIDKMTNSLFEDSVQTAVHELIHGLAFIISLYPYYFDTVTQATYTNLTFTDSMGHLILQTPRMANITKNYFNCYHAKGAVMENEGGSGSADSHFERSIYYTELMTASTINNDFVITEFTWTLLEDSGFYRLSAYSPDAHYWGRGRGCDFIERDCKESLFPEFCDLSGYGCTFYGDAIGKCSKDKFSDSCYFQSSAKGMDCRLSQQDLLDEQQRKHFQQMDAYFGYLGKCIKGGISTDSSASNDIGFSCYLYQCLNDNKQVTVSIDGMSYDCSEKSKVVKAKSGSEGDITCPDDPQMICQAESECENQCNSRGFCMNKQCTCIPGYAGTSCESECLLFRDGSKCVLQCGTTQYQDELTKYCIGCPANCKTCTYIDKCTECVADYHLIGGFCDPLTTVDEGAGLENPYLLDTSMWVVMMGIVLI